MYRETENQSGQKSKSSESQMTTRLEIASRALNALLSNPAVVQQNDMNGWHPANSTYKQLCDLSVELADMLMKSDRDLGIKTENT